MVEAASDEMGSAIGSVEGMGLAEAATTIAPLVQNLKSAFDSMPIAITTACE